MPRLPARLIDALSTAALDSLGGSTHQGLVLVVDPHPTTVPAAVPSSVKPDEEDKKEKHVLQSPRAAVAAHPTRACDGEQIAVPGWGMIGCSDDNTVLQSLRVGMQAILLSW